MDDTAQLRTLISCSVLLCQRSTTVSISTHASPAPLSSVCGACHNHHTTAMAILTGSMAIEVVIWCFREFRFLFHYLGLVFRRTERRSCRCRSFLRILCLREEGYGRQAKA